MTLVELEKTLQKTRNYQYIMRVGVFGSYARGDVWEESDLDILIDYDNSSDECTNQMGQLMEDIETVFTGKIDYITLNGLMKSKNEEFREEVLRDVKWIYSKG